MLLRCKREHDETLSHRRLRRFADDERTLARPIGKGSHKRSASGPYQGLWTCRAERSSERQSYCRAAANRGQAPRSIHGSL